MLPVVAALFNGLILFVIGTVSLAGPERHTVLLVAAIGAIIVCAVLVVTLALVVRRPMLELEESIQRVSDGDLKATVTFADRQDDIGDLGRNFNLMVRQLRESRQEIERLHATQMSRAEHLATLGELAAGLAHEIRNPLAGIAGVMDIIGRDLPSTSPARDVLKDVREEVLRINRIVTDLLETARPKPPQIQAADLNTTIEQAILMARQQVRTRPVQVLFTANPSMPLVCHDPALLQQVVLNLVMNGIQAITGEGKVEIDVAHEDPYAFITVKDTGRGISPDALPRIFKPFFTTRKEGTGLGLSLASGIVQSHGGTIGAHSILGQGTQFRIQLPIVRAKSGS